MIPCKPSSEHPQYWKKLFADEYVGLKNLPSYVLTEQLSNGELQQIDTLFPIQLTQRLLSKISNNGETLKQYLPSHEELTEHSSYSENPVGDIEATQMPGVIKKYQHRALLITSSTCPVHCRYCFRKNYPYESNNISAHQFKNAIEFFRQDTSINEIILSGGDPLSLDDFMLGQLFESIENIPHITTIRLHTKFPSIFPERITAELLHIFESSSLNKVCVFHINHPDEVTTQFCEAAKKIKQTNTTTLNQSVLLNQVNNNALTLIELSRKLFAAGVLPYYLHMLDKAKGTHHFQVNEDEAKDIMRQLKAVLPGYLVPKLAKEIAGANSKIY